MTLVWESGITLQHPDNNDPLLDLNTQPRRLGLLLPSLLMTTLSSRVGLLPLMLNHYGT